MSSSVAGAETSCDFHFRLLNSVCKWRLLRGSWGGPRWSIFFPFHFLFLPLWLQSQHTVDSSFQLLSSRPAAYCHSAIWEGPCSLGRAPLWAPSACIPACGARSLQGQSDVTMWCRGCLLTCGGGKSRTDIPLAKHFHSPSFRGWTMPRLRDGWFVYECVHMQVTGTCKGVLGRSSVCPRGPWETGMCWMRGVVLSQPWA